MVEDPHFAAYLQALNETDPQHKWSSLAEITSSALQKSIDRFEGPLDFLFKTNDKMTFTYEVFPGSKEFRDPPTPEMTLEYEHQTGYKIAYRHGLFLIMKEQRNEAGEKSYIYSGGETFVENSRYSTLKIFEFEPMASFAYVLDGSEDLPRAALRYQLQNGKVEEVEVLTKKEGNEEILFHGAIEHTKAENLGFGDK